MCLFCFFWFALLPWIYIYIYIYINIWQANLSRVCKAVLFWSVLHMWYSCLDIYDFLVWPDFLFKCSLKGVTHWFDLFFTISDWKTVNSRNTSRECVRNTRDLATTILMQMLTCQTPWCRRFSEALWWFPLRITNKFNLFFEELCNHNDRKSPSHRSYIKRRPMNVNIKYKPTNPFLPSLRECGSPHLRKDGPIAISKWPQLFKVGAPKAGRVSWHVRFFFVKHFGLLFFAGVAVLFDVAFAERLLVMCFWPALAALPGSVVLPLTFGWQRLIHIISGRVVECTSNQCSMGTTSCRLPWCCRELEVLSRWILIITRLQSVLPHWCHAGLHLIYLDMQLFQQCSCGCCWRVRLCVFRALSCFNILSRNGRPDTSWTSTTKTVRSWSTDFVFTLPEIASTLDAVKLRTSQKTPKLCWIWFEPRTSWCVFERQKTNKNKKGT